MTSRLPTAAPSSHPLPRRARRLGAVALVVAALTTTGLVASPSGAVTTDDPPPPTVTAGPGDYVGGGTINVIARAPGPDGHFVAGGDSQGLYRSDDGITWSIANAGLDDKAHTRVAAVTYAPGDTARAPVWLAAVGDAGSTGGSGALLASSDDGSSWQTVSPLRFDGGNAVKGDVPHDHPRSVGHLLQVVTVAGRTYAFAGTFDKRVVRCELVQPADQGGPVTCQDPITLRVPPGTGTTHNYVRSLAVDASGVDPVLYSASYSGGILRYTDLGSATPKARLLPAPMAHVEELAVAGGVLVAAGDGGLAVSRTQGGGWVSPQGLPAPRTYTSVAAAVTPSPTGDVVTVTAGACLVAGPCRPVGVKDVSAQVVRFTATVARTTVQLGTLRDLTGTLDPTAGSPFPDTGTQLGAVVWVGSDVLVDPVGDQVWVTGRGAVYRTSVPADGAPTWSRATAGLPLTFSRRIVVAGTGVDDESVAFTDADWIQVTTGAGLISPVVRSGADILAKDGSAGIDLAWSQDPDGGLSSTLVTGTGNQKANTGGAVSVRTADSASATMLPMPAVSGARPLGLDAQEVASATTSTGSTTQVAAWFQRAGLHVWSGTAWKAVKRVPRPLVAAADKGGRDLQVLWAPRAASQGQGSRGIFVSVPSTNLTQGGVWRFDGLSTWTQVAAAGVGPGTDVLAMAGEGAGDGFSLLVAGNRQVTRYTFPDGGTAAAQATWALDADHGDIAGLAVARATGRPAVVTSVDPATGAQPDLLLLAPDLTSASPSGAGDLPSYRSQARFPAGLALSADGTRAYVTTQGQGVVAVRGLAP